MLRSAAVGVVLLALTGCHLLFPFDPAAPPSADARADARVDAASDVALEVGADLPPSIDLKRDAPLTDAPLTDAPPDASLPDMVGPDASTGGALTWARQAGKSGGGFNQCTGVAASPTGPVLAGSIAPGADLGGGIFTVGGTHDVVGAAYNATNKHDWSANWGGDGVDRGWAVASDASGNTYFTGAFTAVASFGKTTLTSGGKTDIFVASYTPGGTPRWAVRFGGTEDDGGYAVAVASGTVYVTGYFKLSATFGTKAHLSKGGEDIFVLALNTKTGAVLKAQTYGGAKDDSGESVAADSSGVVFAGRFRGAVDYDGKLTVSNGGSDGYIGRVSSAGSLLWGRAFGDTQDDVGYGVALDAAGNSYLTGHFWNKVDLGGGVLPSYSVGGSDVLLASFDPKGKHRWSRRLGGAKGDQGWALDVAGSELYLTGWFNGTADFGGGPLTSASQYTDIFVASYAAASGAHRWSRVFGNTGSDFGYGVAAAADGVYLCGTFQGGVDFGGTILTSKSQSDLFLVKLSR
jgi:hypothetical protein